jgi:hypothetical protein
MLRIGRQYQAPFRARLEDDQFFNKWLERGASKAPM